LPDARDVPDAAPPPDGSSGEAGTAPVVATPPSTGRARIDSVPWSVVSWRGRTLGETPVLEAELPAGRQVLLLTDEHGREHRCSVRVVPGRLVKVRFDLAMDCR
jgi:hypothetical protein